MIKFYTSNQIFRSLLILFAACVIPFLVNAQVSINPAFNSTDRGFGFGDGFNGTVTAVKVQADGRVLVGGQFTRYNGAQRLGLARLKGNNQGLDSTFGSFINYGVSGGSISQFAIQPDGKIVVVGSFTQFGASAVNRIVRLNPDGTQDFSFLTGTGADGNLFGVEILNDGKILVAGNFNTFNGANRSSLVRLLPNGTVDITFNAGFGGPGIGQGVRGIKTQPDNKILVFGDFLQTFNGQPLLPVGESHFVIRLEANGTLDGGFTIPFGGIGVANTLDLGPTGNIYLGGNFTNVYGTSWVNLAALQPNGSLLNSFVSPFEAGNGGISKLIFLPGGNLVLAGLFTQVGTVFRGRMARIQSNGNLDPVFANDTGSNGPILAMDQDGLGRFIVGGFFKRIDETQRRSIGRVSALGLVDLPFSQNTGADDVVYSMALQPNGRLILGGDFGYFNWNKRNGVVKLLPNGQIDLSFASGKGANGAVRTVGVQSDKKILVGGKFNTFNSANRRGLVRLDSNGLVDPGFTVGLGANDTVWTLAQFSNGKILVGGDFTNFNGQNFNGIVRLHPNGAIDNTFDPGTGFNGRVRTIKIYQDSIIYVGGSFNTFDGFSRNGIVRLDQNGNLNPLNNQGTGISVNGEVKAIAFLSNGQVMVGGRFPQYNGTNRLNLVRMFSDGSIDPNFNSSSATDGPVRDMFVDQPSGSIYAAGDFDDGKGIGRNGIIRLKPSGSKDLGFTSGTGTDDPVNTVLENGNEILIGGEFTGFEGTGRNRVASLINDPLDFTVWDGSNWDLGPPNSTLDAFIDGPYNGVGFTCRSLTVLEGESLTANSDIEVYGEMENKSNTQIVGKVVLKGSSSQNCKGKIQHLTIDNASGVNLTGTTEITGTLKLENGAFSTNGHLVLISNASGTARIAKVESGAALFGDVTVQRFVPGNTPGWFLIGTPCENQFQTDWTDDFAITNNTFFLHNEGGTVNNGLQINGWEFAPNNISTGRGYRAFFNPPFFNNGAVFDNKGPIITGTKSFAVSFTPIGYGGGGWNLLSNPYPCEIDFNALSRTNIGGQLHIWNHDVSAYGTYTIGTGISVFGVGQYIASSQGFFVKASAPSPSLQITEDAKPLVPAPNTFLRIASNDPPDVGRFYLKNSNNFKDEIAIRWMNEASPNFDPDYDADKFGNGPMGITIYSRTLDGKRTSIQARPFEDKDSVYFGYSAEEGGNYFFEIKLGDEIFQGKDWVLRDLESGNSFPILTSQYSFPFEVPSFSLEATNRFLLVGKLKPLGISAGLKTVVTLYPNPGSSQIRLQGLRGTEKIEIFDVHGKSIWKAVAENDKEIEVATQSWKPGLFCIQIHSASAFQNIKWVKK